MNKRMDDGAARSIRQRISNELRSRGEDPSVGLQRYAVERFLFRLGTSPHRDRLVLKGATLFAIWGTAYRPTRDIDFTGYGSSDEGAVRKQIREICESRDAVDALLFDTDSISTEPIRDGSEYKGLRVRLQAQLGSSQIPIQIDIGFGNAIVPGPEEQEVRTILGDPPPRILAYPPESVVAEKFNAMVTLAERNSRYKDFYDLYTMACEFSFERSTLVHAVRATFERRSTPIDTASPVALTPAFYADEQRHVQWRAYVTSKDLTNAPTDFVQVGELLLPFLRPLWEGLRAEMATDGRWRRGGAWS